MPSGPSTKYKGQFLDTLREKVIDRYKKNNEGIVEKEVIKTPGDNRSKQYEKFQTDIKISTGILLSLSTLCKFLYRKIDKNTNKEILDIDKSFENATIETLEDYVNKTRTSQGIVKTLIIPKDLRGVEIIDSRFKDKLEADGFTHTYSDFFLAKNDNYCQWYGVVRNWDYKEREPIDKVKQQIKECFNWESRVSAVIHGAGGSGKSTFLRRVAIDHINKDFVVLWVTDINFFCDSDLAKIGNTDTMYLVFIEDWFSFESNAQLTITLLNRLKKLENVRVIIGDRDVFGKEYRKQVFDNNYFELLAEDNETIIKKVIALNDVWTTSAEEILKSPEIYNTPLFLILFVIARSSEEREQAKTKDILSRFKEIIENDLKKIHEKHPGLTKSLYYISNIFKNKPASFTWQALLTLADSYAGTNTISKQYAEFTIKKPICKILSHYISLDKFIVPGLECIQIINFHHDLIAEELSHAIDNDWYFDTSLKYEILETLIDNNELIMAREVFRYFSKKEISVAEKKGVIDIVSNVDYMKHFAKIILNGTLKDVLGEDLLINDKRYWRELFMYMTFFGLEEQSVSPVAKILIDHGCKNNIVIEIYERSLNNKEFYKNYFIPEISKGLTLFRKEKLYFNLKYFPLAGTIRPWNPRIRLPKNERMWVENPESFED